MNHCNGLSDQLSELSINEHSASYGKLLECGLSVNVAKALDAVFKQGKETIYRLPHPGKVLDFFIVLESL